MLNFLNRLPIFFIESFSSEAQFEEPVGIVQVPDRDNERDVDEHLLEFLPL